MLQEPLPSLIEPGLRLLFVGINPGLRSAATGHHFAGPGNRFWAALHAAGISSRLLSPEEQEELLAAGVGITNLVTRPTARADEISRAELRAGAARLARKVAQLRPAAVGILGVTAYRIAFSRPNARVGRQAERLENTELWVLHNPSGLNAHALPADHASAFRQLATAAGLATKPNGGAEAS